MKLGVALPQNEDMQDPSAARDFAQAVEDMGYDFLVTADHVVGAEPTNRPPGWRVNSIYNHKTFVHEPLILFAYLGAVTSRLNFSTEIIILPQRQTVLFAKQAAELDYLTGGRLSVGIGIGWNGIEYESLNEDFKTRGRRISEQIKVLRALWTEEVVDFEGRWHRIDRVGVKPLPLQRPIPIWIGGHAEPVLKRTAALADGWLPQFDPEAETSKETVALLRQLTAQAGRAATDVGIEGRIVLPQLAQEEWGSCLEDWKTVGATQMSVSTNGLSSLKEHLAVLEQFKNLARDVS